jgi:exodeoxyribonuclease VII small subunit
MKSTNTSKDAVSNQGGNQMDSTAPDSARDAERPTFESALASLAEIVHQLEQGELSLSESLARYEQGVRLLRECYDQLESAERRVELLRGFNARGEAVTAPFEETAMELDEKADARGMRRGVSARGTGGQRAPDACRGVDGTEDSI